MGLTRTSTPYFAASKTWMAGTSPAMTEKCTLKSKNWIASELTLLAMTKPVWKALHVHVGVERIVLNELAAWFDHISHQFGELIE